MRIKRRGAIAYLLGYSRPDPDRNEEARIAVISKGQAGAAGTIGSERAAKSPPDGYTMRWPVTGPMTIAPFVYRN